jgi:hypothetical protein
VDEFEEDHQRDKDSNVQRYARRAEAGMPLFDAAYLMGEMAPRPSELVPRD